MENYLFAELCFDLSRVHKYNITIKLHSHFRLDYLSYEIWHYRHTDNLYLAAAGSNTIITVKHDKQI